MADELPIPDLLSATAGVRVDALDLHQTLTFAFAAGGTPEGFDGAIAAATLPKSTWDRAHFARDLFLEQLVGKALGIRIGQRAYAPNAAYLLRALGEPPADPAEADLRRGVLRELEDAKHRADFEAIYVELVRLRALFCMSRDASARLRRLEILRATRAVIGALSGAFEGAKSALSRLRAFGEALEGGEACKNLDALLDHEKHMATVDLRVRIGADGELSSFAIVGIRENSENPFHTSLLGRWFSKLRLALRGYRVGGGVVVENMFEDVFGALEPALVRMFQLLGDQEFYLSALGFKARADALGLPVCFPDAASEGGNPEIDRLWNPLLLASPSGKEGGTTPVPCDLAAESDRAITLITGPNSGGKTRVLQAIALAQIFAQAGFFVAAKRASVPRAEGLFVSLIEESRADQPEGQLGMELLRIRRLFEELRMGSLVLLDELCSGTNPSEGEEIAQLVLSLLPEMRARAFVTTHLLSFAARLAAEKPIPGLEFAQVALDASERPTYGFTSGVAKTSLARRTAARLGVTKDELLDLIAARKRAAEAECAPPERRAQKATSLEERDHAQ